MPSSFLDLRAGDQLPEFSFSVSADEVVAYLEATAGASAAFSGGGRESVPPLALGALTLAGLMDTVAVPDSLFHTGQEFEFIAAVPAGATLTARIHVAQRSERKGTLFTTFGLDLRLDGRTVMRGAATVLLPSGERS